jgi:hypothetical protein
MKDKIMEIMNGLSKLDDDWVKSEFLSVRTMTPKKKGVFGEKTYLTYLEDQGIKHKKSTSTDYDVKVGRKQIEVKMATRTNKDKKGNFSLTFFQIRPKQDYDDLVFVCIYPEYIDIKQISKKDFMYFARQHPKQIIWAGGQKKRVSCDGNINENDLFHFVIPNNMWGEKFVSVAKIWSNTNQ